MRKFLFLCLIVISAANPATAQNDIRRIDFLNFTYDVQIFENSEKIKVTRGEYSRSSAADDKLFLAAKVAGYGDLNGDGQDEAVIVTTFNTGGTGNFTSGWIFTMQSGKPVLLTNFAGGDRAYDGLADASINAGVLSVARYDVGGAGGACCPEYIVTTNYKWSKGALAPFGEKFRRAIRPIQRVAFKKGASLSILPLTIEKYDRRRFAVSAKKGQTLLVSSGAEGVRYDLFTGAGDVENTGGGMIVKLRETGDFVFEVVNDTGRSLSFSLTVQID